MDYVIAAERVAQRLAEIDETVARLEAERKAILAAFAHRQEMTTPLAIAQETLATGDCAPEPPADSGDPYVGSPVDFSGCTNLEDRVLAIAKTVGGTFHTMGLAVSLIQRGESQGSPANLRARIIHLLRDHPCFVKEGPSRFRFIGDDSSKDSSFPTKSAPDSSNSDSSTL